MGVYIPNISLVSYIFVQTYVQYVPQCNLPFIGNDGFCGLDTDSDGCPDVDLGCLQENCLKVCICYIVCVHAYIAKCNHVTMADLGGNEGYSLCSP